MCPTCIAVGSLSVTISQSSIRINGVELRSGSQGGGGRYISLAAAENAPSRPQDTYVAGLGVRDKEEIFKFQVWFLDVYEGDKDKHSGKFSSHVQIDGIDITPDSTAFRLRDYRRSERYQCKEGLYHHLRSGNYEQNRTR